MNREKLKNLLVRTLSGAVLAALLFGATLLSPWGYVALMAAVTAVGVWEFYGLCSRCGYSPQRVMGTTLAVVFFGFGAALFASFAVSRSLEAEMVILAAMLYALVAVPSIFVCELFRNVEHPIANVATTLAGVLYVAFPATLMLAVPLLLSPDGVWNPWYALCYILIIWANDVFAYLTGITIGRHRMCERISPKKSWEGFVGGVVAAVGFALLFGHLLDGDLLLWAGLGGVIAVTGVAGDFVESLFKRSADVKDSGAIMPGHGGMLDRFDALFISAPYVVLYLILVS
ncbi:MAG: phosphatidate cytidylyltransferase [Alistipes sp.]|nr:phosphatidate cytidylyltransferase [Alistipes sp.]